MSHSSDPDQPARRRTTVVVVLAVLMAIVGGVFSITPTTGTVSAWADPPLELAVTSPDDVARPAAPRWSAPEVGQESGSVVSTAPAPRLRPAAAQRAVTAAAGEDPPPGRSPPRH